MDWTEVGNGELDFGDGGGDVRNNLWRILYMKNKLKYMALCLSLLIGVGACSEEEIAYSAGEENKEVILQLNCQLQTNQEVIVSRASTAENRLNDLHFYVFNAAGELTGYKKLVATESSPIPTPGPETVTVKAITGEAYIYALANLNSTIYYLDDADKNN